LRSIMLRKKTEFLALNIFHDGLFLVDDIGLLRFDKHSRTEPHVHSSPDIIYVSQGKMVLRVYGQRIILGAGNVVLLPSGVFHSFVIENPAAYYYLNYIVRLDRGWNRFKRGESGRWMLSPRALVWRNSGNLRLLFERILKCERQVASPVMKNRLFRLFHALDTGFKDAVEISRKPADATSYDRRIVESIRYMRRKTSEHFSLMEFCRTHLGMSFRSFSRLFKDVTGCTPREYMIGLKMKKAESMLRKKIPAKVVAAKLGYEEVHSFYRTFYKIMGHGLRDPRRKPHGQL